MAGHYEVRPGPGSLKSIVWIAEPGSAALLMTTISAERVPLLAEALNRHLHERGGQPGEG